jgi:hypothetical protein
MTASTARRALAICAVITLLFAVVYAAAVQRALPRAVPSNAIELTGLIRPKHSHRSMVGLTRHSGWWLIEALLVRDNRID